MKAAYPLPPEARKGAMFFGDGWLFPRAEGHRVFAPISGSLDLPSWQSNNEDGFVNAVASIKGDEGVTVRIELVTVPRPLPSRVNAGDFLGVAGLAKDGGFWIKTHDTKTRKKVDVKEFFAERLPSGSSGGGAALALLAVGVGFFLMKRKKR